MVVLVFLIYSDAVNYSMACDIQRQKKPKYARKQLEAPLVRNIFCTIGPIVDNIIILEAFLQKCEINTWPSAFHPSKSVVEWKFAYTWII